MQLIKPVRAGLPRLAARSIVALAAAVAAVASLAVAVPRVAGAQPSPSPFPINEPFSGATTKNPNWVFNGSHLTNSTPGNENWLELTNAERNQRGSAILNQSFSSDLGIVVEFQYADFGGNSPGGDGFSFFLIDGSSPPSVGGFGGGLGYSSNFAENPGIVGGYMGVGFDEFGNFALAKETGSPTGTDPEGGRQAQHITVRGPTSEKWPLIASEPAPGGTVETGSNRNDDVRTVQISIIPDGNTPRLSVFSNTGGDTPLETVVNNLELQAPLPPDFKLGFAGGTGGQTNFHEIRDLSVRLPADVSIVKEGPRFAPQNGSVVYTLLVTGNGPNPVPANDPVLVEDDVPLLTNVRWQCSPVPGTGAACIAPTTGMGNTVTARVAFPDRGGKGEAEILITGTVPSTAKDGDTITDTANVVMPPDREQVGQARSSVDTTIVNHDAPFIPPPTANLVIGNAVDDPTPALGENVTFTVTVQNLGPDDTFTTLVHDLLPAGLVFVSATATHGTYDEFGGVWDVGPLTVAEGLQTLTITASAQNTTTALSDVDYVQSDIADPSPCQAAGDAGCGPDAFVTTHFDHLRLAKTVTPATTAPGGRVTFHLAATNLGSSPAADVTVTDKLPPGVTFVSSSSGTYHPGTGTWDVGDLAVGQTRTLDITVIAHATAENAVVEAISNMPDPDPCINPPSLPPPQVTRPYGCPAIANVTVSLPSVPVTGLPHPRGAGTHPDAAGAGASRRQERREKDRVTWRNARSPGLRMG